MMTKHPVPALSPPQLRAARGWLNLSQQDLADACLVNRRTIAEFERGATVPHDRTLLDLQRALEDRGIELLCENGVAVGIRISARAVATPG
jgi:transcriptional regulator with XRE-family HTH domain